MLKRASIIFMNRGPIEARFSFLNPDVCEYMLSIDKKWLQLSPTNAEVLLNLLDKKRLNNLEKLKLIEVAKKEDVYKKFLEVFPDAELIDVKLKDNEK